MFDFDAQINRRGTGSYKWDSPGDPADMRQMWVADMDFASPPAVTQALRGRMEHPLYGYSFPPEGLYRAFAAWEQRRCGWKIKEDWMLSAPGVVPCLHFAIEAFTEKGDGVVVQVPVYPPFSRAVARMGRRLVRNPLRRSGLRYRMDLDHLASVLDKKTKLLLLCSPHNPVGRVWTPEELRDLGELCGKRGVIIVSDEIHCDLIMPGGRFTPLASLREFAQACVTCVSPSKTFNIPGIGGAFALIPNPELRRAFCRAAERTAALCLPGVFSGIAAQAAYLYGESWLEELLVYLAGNYRYLRDFLEERLASLAVFPVEGTYLAWMDFSAYGLSDKELVNALRNKAGVRLNDGPSFGPGGEGFQRLNFACPREALRLGLERIAEAFSAYEKKEKR
jgi:cystathionine beta-lyase